MSGAPGSFGGKLRDARERRGISLREIANTTKISMSALEALERNDLARLPGGIFSRAFVRSYALEVGLDPEETIREFLAQCPADSVTAGHPASEHLDDGDTSKDRRMASTFPRLMLPPRSDCSGRAVLRHGGTAFTAHFHGHSGHRCCGGAHRRTACGGRSGCSGHARRDASRRPCGDWSADGGPVCHQAGPRVGDR
jgi:transcriptional regulator with XRE-family HTH domain